MTNPLANFPIKAWYHALMVAGLAVFLLCGGGLLPALPGTPALLISLGTFFFGLGEWLNHPFQARLVGNIKVTGYRRRPNAAGLAFDLLAALLITFGLWHLLR